MDRRVGYLLLLLASAPAGAGPPERMDPADPGAVVPGSAYRGVLPPGGQGYIERLDAPRLPWRTLFDAQGRFLPETGAQEDGGPRPAARPEPAAPRHDMRHGGHPGMHAGSDGGAGGESGSPGTSDARGRVRSIDREQGKVKLQHGPIEKLGMPGMTMIFRVKDPALLERVREGDEVGFSVEVEGTTFYVTDFQP